ncbi:hypothetical protein F5B20DRAFT_578975 [Whalleya microplaca]|nr:hypothetical protein F5B20DRAFT_578975 [Whalleya microplaca]
MPVRDTVVTYRLRSQALKDYLAKLFNREVSVHISEDGRSQYWFKIPRKLTAEEKDYIYENLRYQKEDDNMWE